jgi:hypothetical protein
VRSRKISDANVGFGSKCEILSPSRCLPFFFKLGHRATRSALRICADIVAKVFLGWRTKILRAADAFYARRREGPHRFIQNRSRTPVVALKSNAAAEELKDQLSRDFWGSSIFDFCNNICQQRTRSSKSRENRNIKNERGSAGAPKHYHGRLAEDRLAIGRVAQGR